MSEITKPVNPLEFRKGYFIEMQCSMCHDERIFAADTVEELSEQIEFAEWKELESDLYGLEGYWCGCDYIDDEDK